MQKTSKIMIAITIIIVLMTAAAIFINTYAEADVSNTQEVINAIVNDLDFNEYLIQIGVTEDDLYQVLYSNYFANYVDYELKQAPEEDENIMASWDILDWHIKKIENFINYIFTGDKDYRANNNNNFDNYNRYNHNRHNNYHNMMPPPPPPNTNWSNGWGQYPPNNSWNNNKNNSSSGNVCNCDCESCKGCVNK